MEGLGAERSLCSSRPFPWLRHPQTEASTLLWKLDDRFPTNEAPSAHRADTEVRISMYLVYTGTKGQSPRLFIRDVVLGNYPALFISYISILPCLRYIIAVTFLNAVGTVIHQKCCLYNSTASDVSLLLKILACYQ